MALASNSPRLRRIGLYVVVLLALALVGSVVIVLTTDDPLYDPDDLFETGVYVNPDRQPRFVFPEELRSTDLSLNRFIDRFFRLCALGKYSEIRLMLSTRSGDPIPPDRFENMFNAMKEARIKSIRRLPVTPASDGHTYLLHAEYDLEPHALKSQKEGNEVRLLVAREEGEWRIGPVSRDIIERIEALDAGTSRPADDGVDIDTAEAIRREPGMTANRPARLDEP